MKCLFSQLSKPTRELLHRYYDAMDEVGILVSPELPIVYQQYLSATGTAGLQEFKSSWVAAIKRHRNHPSIFDWW